MYAHERSLVEQLSGEPFALIGVNSDDDREAIRATAKDKNLNWRSFWDGAGGPIARSWQIRSWPTTYLIDAEGVIRHKDLRGPELDRAIEDLLAEMGHEVKIDSKDSNSKTFPWIRLGLGLMIVFCLISYLFFRPESNSS